MAGVAAYASSFRGPFVYDDLPAILGNSSIRHFSTAFSPPLQTTVGGRPLVNLSLALNYAISGPQVWSYHALNLAIHILAGWTLFGVIGRTLEGQGRRPVLAFVIALLWLVHPLQTESVTYVIQRAESLMGLFYLLTLYAFIRGAEATGSAPPGRSSLWYGWSWLACLLGMATKEVMVTAPLVVLLYDRTFLAGSLAEAWRRRRPFYLSLAATWILLGWLVLGTGGRGGTAGFGTAVPWWAYALTQFRAVAHYLRLSFWPHPLIADYGRVLGGAPLAVAGDALVVGALLVATVVGLRRRSAWGFLGAWFFVILAPSSSVVPVATEIIAEHRMYLPLAAVLAAAVLGADAALKLPRAPCLAVCGLAALGLGVLTVRRNAVYQSSLALWGDTAAKMPGNAGAHNNLGNLFFERGSTGEAIAEYREALRLVPDYADAHYNLGLALAKLGWSTEAIDHYRAALRFRPDDEHIHDSLGTALLQENRLEEARAEFAETLRLAPGWADARVNYANVLLQLGRPADAQQEYEEVLRREPGAADVHNDLGVLLAEAGRLPEAEAHFREALRLSPNYQGAQENLARTLALERGRTGP